MAQPISDASHMGFLERSDVYDAEIARFCDCPPRASPGLREPAMTRA